MAEDAFRREIPWKICKLTLDFMVLLKLCAFQQKFLAKIAVQTVIFHTKPPENTEKTNISKYSSYKMEKSNYLDALSHRARAYMTIIVSTQ